MAVNANKYTEIAAYCKQHNASLIAVSKIKPIHDIMDLYKLGQRDFGENYVQELVEKQAALPNDVLWHFIGHLQSNKVKFIAPFVHLIHGVDSLRLLKEINKQAIKNERIIQVLLQVHIAQETTKFGLNQQEVTELLHNANLNELTGVKICGFMGMASFTDDQLLLIEEFKSLHKIFLEAQSVVANNVQIECLSMGMSSDYKLAINHGSNMVRIGSLLFGAR